MSQPAAHVAALVSALALALPPGIGLAEDGRADAAPALAAADASGVPSGAPAPPPEGLPPSLRARTSVLVPALEVGAVTGVIMGWNRWIGDARWAVVGPQSIGRNLRGGWVLDDDQYWVNQLGHPYQGTFSMAAARSTGLSFWASVPYVVGGSAVWEIVGETDRPSINDQVTTSFAGVLVGEVLHRSVQLILSGGSSPWREVAATLLSPVAAVNRATIGQRGGVSDQPWTWELSAGATLSRIPWDLGGPPAAWESFPAASFVLEHGLPWHPGFQLERPFDEFRVIAAYGGRSDPVTTLLVTGLLAGETFTAGRWRGVWGAYGTFDFDTPGVFRVSTSALGLGASAGAPLAGGLGLAGRAVLSGIALGATGQIPRNDDGSGRDYRFGPGLQSSVELALLAGDRGALRLGLRQYLVFGLRDSPGTELIGAGRVAAVFQVAGDHGVGVEASLWRRDAWEADGHLDAVGRALRIFWSISASHEPAGAGPDPFPAGGPAGG